MKKGKKLPTWLSKTPKADSWTLTAWDDVQGSGKDEVSMTRDEVIALKTYLAHLRGILPTRRAA